MSELAARIFWDGLPGLGLLVVYFVIHLFRSPFIIYRELNAKYVEAVRQLEDRPHLKLYFIKSDRYYRKLDSYETKIYLEVRNESETRTVDDVDVTCEDMMVTASDGDLVYLEVRQAHRNTFTLHGSQKTVCACS